VRNVSTLHLTIDSHSATAPFEQVRTQIASAVAAGQLSAGTKLPTVRGLAADLGLATNTVARAYRELEHESVIELRHGAGAFVSATARPKKQTDRLRTAQSVVTTAVERLRATGVTDEEIRRLFEAELAGRIRKGDARD